MSYTYTLISSSNPTFFAFNPHIIFPLIFHTVFISPSHNSLPLSHPPLATILIQYFHHSATSLPSSHIVLNHPYNYPHTFLSPYWLYSYTPFAHHLLTLFLSSHITPTTLTRSTLFLLTPYRHILSSHTISAPYLTHSPYILTSHPILRPYPHTLSSQQPRSHPDQSQSRVIDEEWPRYIYWLWMTLPFIPSLPPLALYISREREGKQGEREGRGGE